MGHIIKYLVEKEEYIDMTQTEIRSKRMETLNKKLQQIYENVQIEDIPCFIISSGVVCRLDDLGDEYNALVIEYADNLENANKGIFGEDGDLFYMDELSEDEMFNAMVQEIEDTFT